jgi:peptidoglycan/xylan/chitin deacetylase (PgdA/CDA1 family)
VVRQLENLRGSPGSRLEYAIEKLKPLHIDKIEKILSELSVRWKLNQDPPGRGFLTWEEVREMFRSGLISYGSHTATHSILPTLLEEEIKEELNDSREKLIAEKAVNPSYATFCYPNGNFNKKISGMVKDSGYSLAVTTRKGWNDKQSNPFTLRRIGVHQDMSSTPALFGCRIANIF